jgi:Fur family peroxide stress response transcriptional regulator
MNKDTLITEFQAICHEKGLRLTHQRLEIFSELARFDGHPSVDDIYRRVHERMPSISLDTVYRTLDTFERYGLIARFLGDDGRQRFDSNLERHHHLVCRRCHRIVDFEWPQHDRLTPPAIATGWAQLSMPTMEVSGLCPDCQRASESSPT